MSGHWVVTHRAPLVLVRGRRAGEQLRAWGYKPLWSPSAQGHVIDDRHLPDVLAWTQVERISVRLEGYSAREIEERRAAGLASHAAAEAEAKGLLKRQQVAIQPYLVRAAARSGEEETP